MQYVEKHRIELCSFGSKTVGYIKLNHFADPRTVFVVYKGHEIFPTSFDYHGHPFFTVEQALLFLYQDRLRQRENPSDPGDYVEVSYTEGVFDVPRECYDSIDNIQSSLKDLCTLNEVLRNRRIARYLGKKLKEFMLFGRYHLDNFGQLFKIERKVADSLSKNGDVEDYNAFWEHNSASWFTFTLEHIPNDGDKCPCCSKAFTIDDVKDDAIRDVDGVFYHDECWKEYRRLKETDKFTRLIDAVYEDEGSKFELLPNGYCDRDCCAHIPWFLFHTSDGDIIIGWRKRVISIEWQENFKAFDLRKLFSEEEVTKGGNPEGCRLIHAWGADKAFEYLSKVHKAVNPE